MADARPTLAGAAPCVADAPPMLAGAAPCVADAPPMLAGAAPRVADAPPTLAGAAPCVADVPPTLAGAAPCVAGVGRSYGVQSPASGGSFDDESTGRAESDPETTSDNVWNAPDTPGIARLWIVLRDSRGGVDFASYEATVVAATTRL